MLGNNRGQASIEYLMNYAWVVALLIIVGVAVFQLNFGDIGLSISGSGSGLSQQFEQVALIGYRWGANGTGNDTFALTLQNNGDNKITVNKINLSEIDRSTLAKIIQNTSSASLFPGETVTRVLSIDRAAASKKAGDTFQVKIAVNYTDEETSVVYVPNRVVKGKTQVV
ncbi:MAG: hypothetical protein HY366_02795 [Candidatus Aenigmarchaeota archaeon]|nr:hypothetical protein [Candidatus Aenigmarchaeota archaeon]